jgi:SAM-dependent methyltransferase
MSNPRETERTPHAILSEMLGGYRLTQMLYVVATLGVAEVLASAPRSADEIAARVGAHPGSLFRLLRTLAGLGVFSEDPAGCFHLTPLSDALRADAHGSLRPFAVSYGERWWWDSWGHLLHSVRTGETAFDHVHREGLFDYLRRDAAAAAIFHGNMTAMTGPEAGAIASAIDFSGARLVVDVGGGHGALVIAILRKHPNARAILVDEASVVDGARPRLEREGLSERCQFIAGDFFGSLPEGGDVYILKEVVHDWGDERAVAILRSCRRAIAGGGRLLVIERIVPPGNVPFVGELVDLTMLVLTGGRERTEAEYRALLDAAGFSLARVVATPVGTDVIEAVPA